MSQCEALAQAEHDMLSCQAQISHNRSNAAIHLMHCVGLTGRVSVGFSASSCSSVACLVCLDSFPVMFGASGFHTPPRQLQEASRV
eukprot:2022966-Amphidinium_carterae.2